MFSLGGVVLEIFAEVAFLPCFHECFFGTGQFHVGQLAEFLHQLVVAFFRHEFHINSVYLL